jgi:tetratricopeptide (TPR) repeat protein
MASDPNHLKPECLRLLAVLIAAAGGGAVTLSDGEQARAILADLKQRHGGKGLAKSLHLHEEEWRHAENAIRKLAEEERRVAKGQARKVNLEISILRVFDWCQTISDRTRNPSLAPHLPGDPSEDVGYKKIRGVELLLRALVNESYGGQEGLEAGLRQLFGDTVVDGWKKSSDPGDLLSGTMFSQLATLFVDKSEFDRYRPLFQETELLDFLDSQRETIQEFLNDIRRLRNILCHNKRITKIQLELLNLYYTELVQPIEHAHGRKATSVNPSGFVKIDADEVTAFLGKLKEDAQEVKDGISDLKDTLLGETKVLRAGQVHLRKMMSHLDFKIDAGAAALSLGLRVLAGAAVVMALLGAAEFLDHLYEYYEVRHLAARYGDVAEQIYYDENNPEVALTLIDKAIQLDPNSGRQRMLQAYIQGMAAVRELINLQRPYTKDELDRAHQALAQALWLERLDPDQPQPYILRAQIHLVLNQPKKALEELETAIRLAPDNDFAYVRMAELKDLTGDYAGALSEAEHALKVNARSKWAWLWKGAVLGDRQGHWDEARAAYAQALKIDDRFDIAHYNLGWSWIKAKPVDYARARDEFEQATRINPNYKEAYYGLGMAYGYENRYDLARAYLKKSVELDEKYVTGWKWLGIVEDERGDYEAALTDFGRSIALSPQEAELYVRRARVLQRLNRIEEAMVDLRTAADLSPADASVWNAQGELYAKLSEYAHARDAFSKALAINDSLEMAYVGRAEAEAGLNDLSAAEQDFDAALKHATYRPERVFLRRARLLESHGRYDEALGDFRHARDLANDLAPAWLGEARLLARGGRRDEALSAVDRYLLLAPRDHEALDLRASLQRN